MRHYPILSFFLLFSFIPTASSNVDILFFIKKINTGPWVYQECQNNPKYPPYYDVCILNQQNFGTYVGRERIRTIPYSVVNPPNPNIPVHTFWIQYSGGGVSECIDDQISGPWKQDPNDGSLYPCYVLKNFDVNYFGPNYIGLVLKSQCESCTFNPGIGYGMEGIGLKTFFPWELENFLDCSLPCWTYANSMEVNLIGSFYCNPYKVYGCAPGEER